MQQLLDNDPGINIVYTINEPAAFGAATALKAAGRSKDDVILVSVDGGCDAIKNGVRPDVIDATAQQYPENMAREGVNALAKAARGGKKPSGYEEFQELREIPAYGAFWVSSCSCGDVRASISALRFSH